MDQMMNDPAMLEYLLTQGGLSNEVSDLDRQALMAEQLRGRSATPRGRDTGRTFVAANPLEHIASALGQGLAGQQEMKVAERMKGIGGDRQKAMKKLSDTMSTRQPGLPAVGTLPTPGSAGWADPDATIY